VKKPFPVRPPQLPLPGRVGRRIRNLLGLRPPSVAHPAALLILIDAHSSPLIAAQPPPARPRAASRRSHGCDHEPPSLADQINPHPAMAAAWSLRYSLPCVVSGRRAGHLLGAFQSGDYTAFKFPPFPQGQKSPGTPMFAEVSL
jgi:hypothetical protein